MGEGTLTQGQGQRLHVHQMKGQPTPGLATDIGTGCSCALLSLPDPQAAPGASSW